MDNNKSWLGGRLFNTASPRLGAPTQWEARPQDGCPMKRKARLQFGRPYARPQGKQKARLHICKLGAPTQRKAHPQDGPPNTKLISNKNVHRREHYAKRRAGGWIRTNFGLEVDFLIRPHQVWAPQCNARHVRKMGAQNHHNARPQVGCPNATQGTSATWVPQRTSTTQMQGTSARPQVGRRNAMQGTSARWSPKRKTHPQGKRPHKGVLG
jgi:hypothetical protein